MARLLKSTILDRFYDEFLEMEEGEQRVTIAQMEGMIRASRHQREKVADIGKQFEAAVIAASGTKLTLADTGEEITSISQLENVPRTNPERLRALIEQTPS